MGDQDVRILPPVTAEQMAAVDRAMFDVCGLDVLQVMEVAGRAVAVWIRQEMFGGDCAGRRVVALCGRGGNGGDALVAAKYLLGWGARPVIVRAGTPADGCAADHQLRVASKLAIPEAGIDTALGSPVDLIVDGLLGFSGTGAPRGVVAELIDAVNQQGAPVVAIDMPSGMDANTGEVHDPYIRATATITLGLPKHGLMAPGAARVCGRTVIADIGLPDVAFRAAGVDPPQFRWRSDFVELA
jgi:NAD(P)H-hydrate epimerase